MRRVVVLSAIIFFVMLMSVYQRQNLTEFSFGVNSSSLIFLNHQNFDDLTVEKTINGNGLILKTTRQKAAFIIENYDGVVGQAIEFRFDTSIEANKFIKSLTNKLLVKIIDKHYTSGSTIYSGFSPKISSGISVNGKSINIQISINENSVVVGSPLILHSF